MPLIVRAIRTRGRAVLCLAEAPQRDAQRGVVVTVAGRDATAERPELRLQALEGEDLLRRPIRLQLVAVDHDQQPADTLVRGSLQRLPVLALLQLSVARHHDHPAAAAEVALRPSNPAGFRDPHPERSGVGLDPGHADVRVAVEAAQPPEPEEPLGRDDAQPVERGVETGDVVALGREEHVAVR